MIRTAAKWIAVTTLTCAGTLVHAQNDAADLLEAALAVSGGVYGPERSYERAALPAFAVDTLTNLANAAAHPGTIARVTIECEAPGAAHTMDVIYGGGDPAVADAEMVAKSFVPAPRTVLAGFINGHYDARIDDAGIATYTMAAADTGLNVPAALHIDYATARMLGYRVGEAGAADAIEVTYHYGAADEPYAIETRFASSASPGAQWALIDVPAPFATGPASEPLSAGVSEDSPLLDKGMSNDTVSFSDVVNTLPPINVGSTNCNAAGAPMVNLGVVSIGADIAVGVSLNTNTTLNMTGTATADYPVEDAPGEADLAFVGDAGSSAIEYSLAYAATFCVVVDPIIGPTCNLSASLANGSVTVASGTQTFTPFLLPGDSDRPVCTGDALNPFTVGVNPSISICDLTFGITGGLSIDPNLDYCVEGDSLDVVQTFDEKQLTQEGDSIRVPAQGAGADFMATWNGTSSLAGSLTVSPTIGITIPVLGDLNVPLPSFPFNLGTINGDTFNLDAPFRIAYPDIDADDTEIMFDDTELGMTSEFTRTIANMGEAPLELIEIVTDNAAFSVLMPETPETVEPGESVDAVIMFAPDAAGTADGMLTIMSNDPDETALSIALTANGVEAPGEGDGEGDGDGDGDGNGGGCPASASSFAMRSSGTPFNADLLAVLLAAGLLAIAPRKETRRH